MNSSSDSVRIRINGVDLEVRADRPLTIGRVASADIRLDHSEVSRQHATLCLESGQLVLRDLGSSNGTYHHGTRVTELLVNGPTLLRLGNPGEGIALELIPADPGPPTAVASGPPTAVAPPEPTATIYQPPGAPPAPRPTEALVGPEHLGSFTAVYNTQDGQIRIGRDPGNDVVISDLQVSRHHAELVSRPDGSYELRDLGSHNGSFVNGARVSRAVLADGDLVGIGGRLLRYVAGGLEEYLDDGGHVGFHAVELTVRVPGKVLLDRASFSLPPSSLLGVVGPSGAGKSTLLNALTGFRPAKEGSVRYGGRDLYQAYDDIRQRMGYVPQDDILHSQLTVRRALRYGAELRFPPDVDKATREARVEEVLAELGLSDRADLPIERLSGGQRKRVSVALELLTKPSLIFLDEPTSGLDPGNERLMMELLHELAEAGHIVVVVTHSTQSLDLCDRVLMLGKGGQVAYYGPPEQALGYFEARGCGNVYSSVFTKLENPGDIDWHEEYRRDPAYARYVGAPLAELDQTPSAPPPDVPKPPQGQVFRRQFTVLTRRYLSVLARDRRTLLLMALQAPLFGLLFSQLFASNRFTTSTSLEAPLVIWLMVIGGTWLGVSNSAREIVKELPIYRRERSVGLSIPAYLASKVVVLGTVTVLQCLILAAITLTSQSLPPQNTIEGIQVSLAQEGNVLASQHTEVLLVVAAAGLAAMALGFLASAIVRSSDQALVILPLLLVPQVVLSGPFVALPPALAPAGYVASAQWGVAAANSTVDINQVTLPQQTALVLVQQVLRGQTPDLQAAQNAAQGKPEWTHSLGVWIKDMAGIVVLGAGCLAGSYFVLRRRDLDLLASGRRGLRRRRGLAGVRSPEQPPGDRPVPVGGRR